MSDFDKALKIIRRIENKHGSVLNVPEDDPELVKAQKLLGDTHPGIDVVERHRMFYRNGKPIERDPQKIARRELERGIGIVTIAHQVKLPTSKIEAIRDKYSIVKRAYFPYVVLKFRKPRVYFINLRDIGKQYFGMNVTARQAGALKDEILRKMRKNGYDVDRLDGRRWGTVPDGSLYCVNGKLYKKDGNASYLQIPARLSKESDNVEPAF